jgi:hypothetical protein
LPLSTKSLRVSAAHNGLAAGSSPAAPANLRLQRKLRHRRPSCFASLDIADRAYVLDQGGVVYRAAARELLADNDIKERYCSV